MKKTDIVNIINIGLVLLLSAVSIILIKHILVTNYVWILSPIVIIIYSYVVQYLISPIINNIFFKK